MQHAMLNTWNPSVSAGARRCAVLALCLALAACKPAAPESAASSEAAATPPVAAEPVATAPAVTAPAPAPADTPEAAAPQAPAAPANDADDEDDMGPGLDDSYTTADLRHQYQACINASDEVMPEIQACQQQEFAYQQGRMRAALNRIDAGPDSYFKDEVMNWQAEYMRHTDTNCRDDQQQRPVGESESCYINRYANRARALEALADMVSSK
ncbi:hypothetical protein [Stenotrophomonas sp. PS02289]|uniref:hypothetical protein n=1 Tax=Stenotrophomonas sp. PS02289 TaxID=2991422 RepID=UPI00249B6458|nr:hypothetical protein [Stenotrophomonas sp. PS02289]